MVALKRSRFTQSKIEKYVERQIWSAERRGGLNARLTRKNVPRVYRSPVTQNLRDLSLLPIQSDILLLTPRMYILKKVVLGPATIESLSWRLQGIAHRSESAKTHRQPPSRRRCTKFSTSSWQRRIQHVDKEAKKIGDVFWPSPAPFLSFKLPQDKY